MQKHGGYGCDCSQRKREVLSEERRNSLEDGTFTENPPKPFGVEPNMKPNVEPEKKVVSEQILLEEIEETKRIKRFEETRKEY